MATTLTTRVRTAYGAHPAHLLLLVAAFAVVAYAVQLLGVAALWNPDVWWQSVLVWFVGAAVLHDLVLFPLYAAADRVVVALTRDRRSRRTRSLPLVNFVRVPLLALVLVTGLFLPGIIRQGSASYTRATGQTQEPFLGRWLVLCAVIVLLGLLAYAVARVRASRRPAAAEAPEAAHPVVPSRPALATRPAAATRTATDQRVSPGAVLVVVVLAVLVAVRRRS